jgi:hypothetical protein
MSADDSNEVTSPHSWTILEGENPRISQKIRSSVFQCSRVHKFGRTLVVFPNKSEAFKLTMNAGYCRRLTKNGPNCTRSTVPTVCTYQICCSAHVFHILDAFQNLTANEYRYFYSIFIMPVGLQEQLLIHTFFTIWKLRRLRD